MNRSTRQHVADTVARLRERAELSQVDLTKRAGINQKTVSDLERATDKSPTLATLDAIAAALGMPTWVLLHPTLADGWTPSADALIRAYVALPEDARAQVDRVAEAEARYSRIKVDA